MRSIAFLILGLLVCALLGWAVYVVLGLESTPGGDTVVPPSISGDSRAVERTSPAVEERTSTDPSQPTAKATPEPRKSEAESFAEILDAEVARLRTEAGLSGPGGKYGGRRGGRRRLRGRMRSVSVSIGDGLRWLATHQSPDGHWDCDGFMRMDATGVACDGGGIGTYDIGVTGLALLSLLGDGNTIGTGPYSSCVRKAVIWLESQQNSEGRFGNGSHFDFIYDHAIATYAMCEAYGTSRIAVVERPAQLAIDYLESRRHPQGGWRYTSGAPDSDVSITIWGLIAYRSARDFRLKIPRDALTAVATFLDFVTDPQTGRAGYSLRGEPPSRRGNGFRFPGDKTESLTAIGLFGRFFLGQNPRQVEVMKRAADTILARPIAWTPDQGNIDFYYWWFGSQAMYQMGGKYWTSWSKGLKRLPGHQRVDGNAKGSWDPVGVWGPYGGRIASTALTVLTLETYYRLTRLVR